jgi:hypothetical protein
MRKPRYVDWLASVAWTRRDRPPPAAELRDSGAFLEAAAAFSARGCRIDRVVYGHPSSEDELEQMKSELRLGRRPRLKKLDLGFLGPGRVLVVCTRLPLSDLVFDNKRKQWVALDELTARIVEIGWLHFRILARTHVELWPRFASQLAPGFERRARIQFVQNCGAFYTWCQHLEERGKQHFSADDARTAGYVLHLKQVPSLNGADLLVFFGMGGVETLALAHHLRNGLGHLLDEPGFSMVEFERAVRPQAPSDAGFASLWRPRVILHADPLVPQESDPEAAMARLLAVS